MAKINDNFLKLPGSYLFSDIAKKVAAYRAENSDAVLILMGIGDVTRPLVPAVIEAMHNAVDEMSSSATFKGYGPDFGYNFLRESILENDYAGTGIELDEIFVSDGAKCDCGNISEIFSIDNVVAVCDPVYPVYVDSNAMTGRAGDYINGKWSNLVYMPITAENGFVPELPKEKADMIYLCVPNNPTGTTLTRDQLKKWVEHARKTGAVILFDSAYEAYITEPDVPHSIYEIEGAKECAIEFRSFSKTAGFTGTRCAYTVIPKALVRDGVSLNSLWARRQSTKFNGVPYVTQRGAAAIYTPEGKVQTKQTIEYYMNNAKIIRNGLSAVGLKVYGGINAPYIWAQTPGGMGSWEFFDFLLRKANVVTTPGAGFGPSGEGYIRLTAFNSSENTRRAVEKITKVLKNAL